MDQAQYKTGQYSEQKKNVSFLQNERTRLAFRFYTWPTIQILFEKKCSQLYLVYGAPWELRSSPVHEHYSLSAISHVVSTVHPSADFTNKSIMWGSNV